MVGGKGQHDRLRVEEVDRPGQDHAQPVSRLAQRGDGPLLPGRELDVGAGPLHRPAVLVGEPVELRAALPVAPGQLEGVLHPQATLLRGVDEEVPFVADERTLRNVERLTLRTMSGWLDVHRHVPGGPSYEALRRRAERQDLGGFSVLVASLDDLAAMNHAAGRPQDLADLDEIEAIKRLRRRAAGANPDGPRARRAGP